MDEAMKAELELIAKRHALQSVDDVYGLAQVYVDSTESPLDNTLLEGLKLLKQALKDKIDSSIG